MRAGPVMHGQSHKLQWRISCGPLMLGTIKGEINVMLKIGFGVCLIGLVLYPFVFQVLAQRKLVILKAVEQSGDRLTKSLVGFLPGCAVDHEPELDRFDGPAVFPRFFASL